MESSKVDAAAALIISASDKAGMEGIERSRINSIILRESGKSSFMDQQRRKDENVNERIKKMQELVDEREAEPSFRSWEFESNENKSLNTLVNEYIRTRRKTCTHVVVDMDSFYISCELLSKPELTNVPACVGRSMILTSNYCARRYGVRSAMAGFIADKLVTELSDGKETLVHLPSNFSLYKEKSHLMQEALSEYDPNLKAYSLDEVYLNLESYLDLRVGRGWSHERSSTFLNKSNIIESSDKNALEKEDLYLHSKNENQTNAYYTEITTESISQILSEMRAKVKTKTGGLTCSAGVAPNFLLAKIASDMNKPDGQLLVPTQHEKIMGFMQDLPVRKISGIGRVTEKILQSFDVKTGKDLFEQRGKIQFLFKTASANFLLRASLGWGDDDKHTENDEEDDNAIGRKGISRERTFSPEGNWTNLQNKIQSIALLVSNDMKQKELMARTLTVKVKLKTFEVFSKSKSLPATQTFSIENMTSIALQLLSEIRNEHLKNNQGKVKVLFVVRLLGIRCSNFLGEEDKKKALEVEQMGIQKFMKRKPLEKTKNDLETNSNNESNNHAHIADAPEQEFKTSNTQKPITNPYKRKSISSRSISGRSSVPKSPKSNIQKTLLTCTYPPTPTQRRDPPMISPIHPLNKTPKVSISSSPSHPVTNTNQLKCPICHKVMRDCDNEMLNRHIDACLNQPIVRKMVQQEASIVNERKKSLSDYFMGVKK